MNTRTWMTFFALVWGFLAPLHAAERAIDKSIEVPATPDQTWDAWTTSAGITSFFAPDAKIDARVGGAFQIDFDPRGSPGNKGADDIRFLALQPKRMISFDWNAPPHLPEARAQRSFVVVRFEAINEKTTRVTLHHTGWGEGGEWDKACTYFDRAWGQVLANLKKRFEQGPQDRAPRLAALSRQCEAATSPPQR